ncbi:MAG: PTS system mannose/fructose/sorbose family transporter subunit IID [Firmicutes bacterium]|jgi:mannose/fructose/N-acetylgalactosamine-specific phosphotransferase system component IID|nr:PTS system mannose/fructose/sorbose family transporter subunit IID [Bacillota bacterium]
MSEYIKLSKTEKFGVIWRSFNFAGNYNFERLMAVGMTDMLIPALRKFCKTKEQMVEALKRHLVFYNCHPYLGAMIAGIMVAMEEKKANDEPIDDATINGVKTAMMGPFAGVGDSFFWGTVHPIFLSLSAALALEGNISGFFIALLFFTVFPIVNHVFFINYGYRLGTNVLDKLESSNILQRITETAKIVGMVVAGGMIAILVKFQTKAIITFGGGKVELQPILDQILPNLLPLVLLFSVYSLLKKRVSPIVIMIAIMLLGVIGTKFGFIG